MYASEAEKEQERQRQQDDYMHDLENDAKIAAMEKEENNRMSSVNRSMSDVSVVMEFKNIQIIGNMGAKSLILYNVESISVRTVKVPSAFDDDSTHDLQIIEFYFDSLHNPSFRDFDNWSIALDSIKAMTVR